MLFIIHKHGRYNHYCMVFGQPSLLPIFYNIYQGSMRDVSALQLENILEFPVHAGIMATGLTEPDWRWDHTSRIWALQALASTVRTLMLCQLHVSPLMQTVGEWSPGLRHTGFSPWK